MGKSANEQYALLTDYDASTAYSQAFHTLYANIRLNWDTAQRKQHSLLVTTPTTQSEEATVAANLAIVAAQSDTPTVLVDADLHSASLQQRFGLGKNPGLSELLAEETITRQQIGPYLQKTFAANLRLLGAGAVTAQGSSLLLSAKLDEVVSCLREYLAETETRPGLVIFHSSAVLAGPDASLLGALAEQTLLTIIKGHTTREQAKQAQEQLQRTHARLVGMIILDI